MLSPVGSRSRGRIGQDIGDDGAGDRDAARCRPQDRPGDGVELEGGIDHVAMGAVRYGRVGTRACRAPNRLPTLMAVLVCSEAGTVTS